MTPDAGTLTTALMATKQEQPTAVASVNAEIVTITEGVSCKLLSKRVNAAVEGVFATGVVC